MPEKFHDKAKEASNKLKGYILSFSSIATGVFFFSLTDGDSERFSQAEKLLLLLAMSCFAVTVLLCLVELHVDSNRFFAIAKQKEKAEHEQKWGKVKALKKLRLRIIYASYISVFFAFLLSFAYMVLRIGHIN